MITFCSIDGDEATALWVRVLEGLDPDRAYGPERPTRRPRHGEECFSIWADGVLLGMWGFRWFSVTTAHVWTGFLPAHRGQGWNVPFQYARCRYLFESRGAKRVEYGVYTSNTHSIHVSSQSSLMTVEGCLKDYIEVDGTMYDCLMFGITLPEWRAKKGD